MKKRPKTAVSILINVVSTESLTSFPILHGRAFTPTSPGDKTHSIFSAYASLMPYRRNKEGRNGGEDSEQTSDFMGLLAPK